MLDAIKALAAENDRLKARVAELVDALEWAEDELASYAPDPACRSKITDDVLIRVRAALKNKDASDD